MHTSAPTMTDTLFADIERQVAQALAEDVGTGDLTASLIPAETQAQAHIITRETAIICGTAWVDACFRQVDANIQVHWHVKDGDEVSENQTLCTLNGCARNLLTGERAALNFLQTLSATATHTHLYAKAIGDLPTHILDTRKTIPGFRLAQKYAVTVGGGHNQRIALYDGILIKENHIAAAGSIAKVLQAAQALNTTANIQIEVESLDELHQALDNGATSVLLDNFSCDEMRQAVAINKKRALLEASGNVGLHNVREIAQTGVDRISIGGLTKNIQAIDLSMRIQMQL